MEQLLALLVGWVDTRAGIINLNTGVVVEPGEADDTVDVTVASGEKITFEGEDAKAILERAELFAQIGTDVTILAQANASRLAADAGAVTP